MKLYIFLLIEKTPSNTRELLSSIMLCQIVPNKEIVILIILRMSLVLLLLYKIILNLKSKKTLTEAKV